MGLRSFTQELRHKQWCDYRRIFFDSHFAQVAALHARVSRFALCPAKSACSASYVDGYEVSLETRVARIANLKAAIAVERIAALELEIFWPAKPYQSGIFCQNTCKNRCAKQFILFITDKAITKLNLGHVDKFEIRISKLAIVVHVLQTTQSLIISRCCFAEDGKEMYQE